MRIIRKLIEDRRGSTLIEYGLVVALIVIVMFVSLNLVAAASVSMWGNVSSKVSKAG